MAGYSEVKYESEVIVGSTTLVLNARVHPSTVGATTTGTGGTVANDEPTGAINVDMNVNISRSRRSFGWHPRYVSIKVTSVGTNPDLSIGSRDRLICLTGAFYDAVVQNKTLTYNLASWKLIDDYPEKLR